jgi:hypothetical protein
MNLSSFYNLQETPNNQCFLKYNRHGYSTGVTDKNTRLKLQQFYFAFLVLFIGLLISFVQLLRERMHHYFEQQQNKVSAVENLARATPKAIEARQINNKVEQNKVSVVIGKGMVENKKVADSILTTKERANVVPKESDLAEEIVELE